MELTGQHLIDGQSTKATSQAFYGENPATGARLSPAFAEATEADVDHALNLANAAFDILQTVSDERIAGLLDAIASGLEEARDRIVARAHAETALPVSRLESECARTAAGARAFAAMVRDGSWVQARIDQGDPNRTPVSKPDLRTMFVGVGPVVVFGASNFPLAISVAGTDTVAAFAARCPVVVKAHPAHPGTCELVGRIIVDKIAAANLPPGMFALLQAAGHEAGLALVRHPLTAVVAFTGSLRGGRALFDAAAARPVPIPVYAEMGSVNPVFILPGAASERAEDIAEGFVRSVNLGVGQFCTNPGMVFALSGPSLDRFMQAASVAVSQTAPAAMLSRGIHAAFVAGVERLDAVKGVTLAAVSRPAANPGPCDAASRVYLADVDLIEGHPNLAEEVFGPSSVVYRCDNIDKMYAAARDLSGNLTATMHGNEQDLQDHAELVGILRRKVGRIIFNGFPTGLEPCSALHHGGPYPATTHSHYTSVGTAAIYRYVRPLCYQGFPDAALPPELQEANPRGLTRLVDNHIA